MLPLIKDHNLMLIHYCELLLFKITYILVILDLPAAFGYIVHSIFL